MRYNPKQLEKKWSAKWLKDKIYEPDFSVRRAPDKKRAKKHFYNLMMFPYPSAEGLHVGNMYAFVGADIYGRKKRMEGLDVFEPIGLDGFGIHSENYAIKIGAHPMRLAEKTQKNFYNQLQIIGNGFAWKEKLETYDPAYYKWTQWIFVQMFKKGLAYRKKAPVNWCPSCKTVLADEQVLQKSEIQNLKSETNFKPQIQIQKQKVSIGVCERCETPVIKKDLTQWFFKITDYAERLLNDVEKIDWSEKIKIAQKNWIGRSEGALITFPLRGIAGQPDDKHSAQVFTTRPDTLFGATFLAISPEVAKHWIDIGWQASKEVKEYISKIISKRADTSMENIEKTGAATGLRAVNPANGEEIPVWVVNYVLAEVGTGAVMAVPAHDQRDFEFASKYKLPIKPVIKPYHAFYLIIEKSLSNGKEADLKKFGDVIIEKEDKNWGKFYRVKVSLKNEQEITKYLELNLLETSEDGGAWYADSMGTTNTVVFPGKTFHVFDDKSFKEYENYGLKAGIPKNQLDIKLRAYVGDGTLFDSKKFSGMDSEKAKWEITKFVSGKKQTNFRLRDWLISRQRYWGPPIPMIFCDACAKKGKGERKEMAGWYAVPEKNLPVKLPFIKEFRPTGKDESPLASAESFYKVKCPSCGSIARRETDVSDTFLDSAWYYLRYPSVKIPNSKIQIPNKFQNPNSKQKVKIPWNEDITKRWLPVHMYIGGAEHAVLHLLYTRFLAKVFYDWRLVHFQEPFSRFRAHGLLVKDGAKMSKSKGNVVNPDEYIKVYGADALRMYLMFLGPFEQGGDFRDDGIRGITRFLERVWKFVGRKKEFAKREVVDKDIRHSFEHALHRAVKKVTEDIDALGYNTAISQLMVFLRECEEKEDIVQKEDMKIFLRLLAPFAPFITEELWSGLGEKKSVHISEWPSFDPKKAEYEMFEMVIQVNGKVRDTVLAPVSISEKEMEKEALSRERIKEIIGGGKPKKIIVVPKRLVNIVV